jgi:uroporphyrinogen-III decarboxylase
MNSLERIQAPVRFEKPDRVPVIAQVFGHAAVLAGVPLDRYVRSGESLARCQTEALEHYGYDAVFALMDVNVETEAMGSVLTYRPNSYPVVKSYVVSKMEAGAHLPIVFDPSASPAVVPYQFFRELEAPRLRRVFDSFRKAGSAANWLHIAGPADPILPLHPENRTSSGWISACRSWMVWRRPGASRPPLEAIPSRLWRSSPVLSRRSVNRSWLRAGMISCANPTASRRSFMSWQNSLG